MVTMEEVKEIIDEVTTKFFEKYKKNVSTTFTVNIKGIISGFWIFGALFSFGFVPDSLDIFEGVSGFFNVFGTVLLWFFGWPIALGEEIARIIGA